MTVEEYEAHPPGNLADAWDAGERSGLEERLIVFAVHEGGFEFRWRSYRRNGRAIDFDPEPSSIDGYDGVLLHNLRCGWDDPEAKLVLARVRADVARESVSPSAIERGVDVMVATMAASQGFSVLLHDRGELYMAGEFDA